LVYENTKLIEVIFTTSLRKLYSLHYIHTQSLKEEVVSLSRQELLNWASESLAFYQLDLSRISTVYLAQVYALESHRIFDSFDLTHPIKVLEGSTNLDGTPPAKQFKHAPLTGLYKKHFTSARFIPQNLYNFQLSKFSDQYFQEALDEASRRSSGYVDDAFTGYLVHQMTIPPIEMRNRANRLTGEWVVFHRHEGRNYYLTLASHEEANEAIHERVVLACDFDKFPFKV
jgi:hypothetical protein